jgi:hypothetical protein
MMFEYRLVHVFSYVVTLKDPPEVIGTVPGGIRANFYVVDGEINGPRLRGKVRPDLFVYQFAGMGEVTSMTVVSLVEISVFLPQWTHFKSSTTKA